MSDHASPTIPITVGTMIVSKGMNSVRYKARVSRFVDDDRLEVMWAFRGGGIWPHGQTERVISMRSIVAVLTLEQFFDATLDLDSIPQQDVVRVEENEEEEDEMLQLSGTTPPTPKPSSMPERPSFVSLDQIEQALSTWVINSEKVVADYEHEVTAWAAKQNEECEKEVAPFELKMAETEQSMRRKIEQMEKARREAKDTYSRLIRKRRQLTEQGTQSVLKDAGSWISEKRALIADARKTIEDCEKVTSPPDELACPITLELMNDPVLAMDGYTYEREAIQHHFDSFEEDKIPNSPCTNVPLQSRTLTPNIAIRSLCRHWQEQQQHQQQKEEVATFDSAKSSRQEPNGNECKVS